MSVDRGGVGPQAACTWALCSTSQAACIAPLDAICAAGGIRQSCPGMLLVRPAIASHLRGRRASHESWHAARIAETNACCLEGCPDQIFKASKQAPHK